MERLSRSRSRQTAKVRFRIFQNNPVAFDANAKLQKRKTASGKRGIIVVTWSFLPFDVNVIPNPGPEISQMTQHTRIVI